MHEFLGRWSIQRDIKDIKAGVSGRLDGQVTLSPMPDGPEDTLLYEEKGSLVFGQSAPLVAERRYLWKGTCGRVVDVMFEDGRPFHKIDLNCTMPFDTHLCDPDFYEVSYDLREWPSWRCTWRVTGPRKDYRLETRFRKVGDVSRTQVSCAAGAAGAERAATENEPKG